MGNRPVPGGEKIAAPKDTNRVVSGGPNYGLSDTVRTDLRQVRNNVAKRTEYLRRLNVREREQAIEFLSDPAQNEQLAVRVPELAECSGMRARLHPHAPNDGWIVDQMARSHCHPNGTPMTLREATRYEMYKGL